MTEVSIRTLNQQTSQVLARVKHGEEIELTERGEVIARIVPLNPNPLAALISAGRAHPATLHGPAPRPSRSRTGESVSAALDRLRDEER
ncbi:MULTISPECIES: type II toxin-antitoxin system Phd/YefM family antitoxin [Mycobacteriaceae]|uniref:Type II toxin-antitoxin system prevent-host-death family antitoxin n=1 Tax=Mycolicibacterium mucogenicum TaxID=56689 RepID=A0A4R5WJ42_MYCMU|nr:type II toxin-antitoxin system prevent-host-death family antitoxin [Mycolicibacterium mucogenicum]MCX8555117.1 type II toxin-antitoxin system prevent-host-death family antitoxin [Mycolicibacterium mucogenicum]TDK90664.1 type II toxin-antitoxin system prevent-host-death family antitoxin [Mycolicibacterium mucogenicum]